MDPKRHKFHNQTAVVLTVLSLTLLVTLSLVFGDTDVDEISFPARLLEDQPSDFSDYSCRYIYDEVPNAGYAQCRFASTCNGGGGLWGSWVFCSDKYSVRDLFLMISPLVVLWMMLLFRLLGSTAEDYFSPSLEMFSVKLGLPPRFAGVSLLALGNGAADVSATMSAIMGDEENGYKMSLGALSGAAMLVGGVIAGIVVIVAGGVPCRGALVRDVTALILTVCVVWYNLAQGEIGPGAYALFLSLYGVFVTIVLVADVYHRTIVLPRQAAANGQGPAEGDEASQQPSMWSRFVTSFSNYDNITAPCGRDTTITDPVIEPVDDDPLQAMMGEPQVDGLMRQPTLEEQETPINLLGQHGILHGDGRALSQEADDTAGDYALVDEQMDQFCSAGGPQSEISASNWSGAWGDGKLELYRHFGSVWDDIFNNEELGKASKFIMICEWPFTVARKMTIAIPCDGYYCRALIALSIVVSPYWFAYYIWSGHDVNLFAKNSILYFSIVCLLALFSGASVLRYAPGGEGRMAMFVATPIALYGFVIAATWVDFIADHLVDVLNFVGIILKIPGSIMGLTILAWGNSMADLSANITMARKGLANMAMTACFAGPIFNILVGLGLGFSGLAAQTGKTTSVVSISTSVRTGFIFIFLNCITILVVGIGFGKGRINTYYGYIAVGLYAVYLGTSITLHYTTHSD
ncbi:MAG: hypothetical protein SGBAC_009026 [Bacillariaceae sp.]